MAFPVLWKGHSGFKRRWRPGLRRSYWGFIEDQVQEEWRGEMLRVGNRDVEGKEEMNPGELLPGAECVIRDQLFRCNLLKSRGFCFLHFLLKYFVCVCMYWIGQEVHLGFPITSYGKPEQTFWLIQWKSHTPVTLRTPDVTKC